MVTPSKRPGSWNSLAFKEGFPLHVLQDFSVLRFLRLHASGADVSFTASVTHSLLSAGTLCPFSSSSCLSPSLCSYCRRPRPQMVLEVELACRKMRRGPRSPSSAWITCCSSAEHHLSGFIRVDLCLTAAGICHQHLLHTTQSSLGFLSGVTRGGGNVCAEKRGHEQSEWKRPGCSCVQQVAPG